MAVNVDSADDSLCQINLFSALVEHVAPNTSDCILLKSLSVFETNYNDTDSRLALNDIFWSTTPSTECCISPANHKAQVLTQKLVDQRPSILNSHSAATIPIEKNASRRFSQCSSTETPVRRKSSIKSQTSSTTTQKQDAVSFAVQTKVSEGHKASYNKISCTRGTSFPAFPNNLTIGKVQPEITRVNAGTQTNFVTENFNSMKSGPEDCQFWNFRPQLSEGVDMSYQINAVLRNNKERAQQRNSGSSIIDEGVQTDRAHKVMKWRFLSFRNRSRSGRFW